MLSSLLFSSISLRPPTHARSLPRVQRRDLLRLQAESAAVQTQGQATAEAKAIADSARIKGEAEVRGWDRAGQGRALGE
jgi:hypothetical protein